MNHLSLAQGLWEYKITRDISTQTIHSFICLFICSFFHSFIRSHLPSLLADLWYSWKDAAGSSRMGLPYSTCRSQGRNRVTKSTVTNACEYSIFKIFRSCAIYGDLWGFQSGVLICYKPRLWLMGIYITRGIPRDLWGIISLKVHP